MKKNLRLMVIFVFVAGVSLGLYLYISANTYRLGFPLDDAWIHQTYARNLVKWGQWAYIPGETSAGSTAPLWSLILAFGYYLRVNPFFWVFGMGWIFLAGLGLLGSYGFDAYSIKLSSSGNPSTWGIGAGILLCLEWHLVWAAGSGMETLLFTLVSTLVLVWLVAGWEKYLLFGALIGASVWLRPDGLTLLAPAMFTILLDNACRHLKIKNSWIQRCRLLCIFSGSA